MLPSSLPLLQQDVLLPYETKLKHQQNVYDTIIIANPCDLCDAYPLKCWMCELTLVMHKQHNVVTCHNELGNTLLSAHITTGEYVACYITVISESNTTTQLMCYLVYIVSS